MEYAFKVGDKVRLVSDCYGPEAQKTESAVTPGTVGVVAYVSPVGPWPYEVEFGKHRLAYPRAPHELELVRWAES